MLRQVGEQQLQLRWATLVVIRVQTVERALLPRSDLLAVKEPAEFVESSRSAPSKFVNP